MSNYVNWPSCEDVLTVEMSHKGDHKKMVIIWWYLDSLFWHFILVTAFFTICTLNVILQELIGILLFCVMNVILMGQTDNMMLTKKRNVSFLVNLRRWIFCYVDDSILAYLNCVFKTRITESYICHLQGIWSKLSGSKSEI